MNVDPYAAHLFTFYFAIISNVTPAVAVAAHAGVGLAKVDPLKTGYEAFLQASAGYLVPFVFVYNPALILVGCKIEIVDGCITAVLGVVALSGGIQGWFWGALNHYQRIMIVVASILLIWYGFFSGSPGKAKKEGIILPLIFSPAFQSFVFTLLLYDE